MNVELLEARWRIGYVFTSELPALARDLMAAGLERPALTMLAAMPADELQEEGRRTFERALRELGHGGLSVSDAALVVARHYAQLLLERRLRARAAVKAIALVRWKGGSDVDALLSPFEHLDREYERAADGPLGGRLTLRLDRETRREARTLVMP